MNTIIWSLVGWIGNDYQPLVPASGQLLGNHPCRDQRRQGPPISMASCKTAATPLLTHRSYCSLALRRRYIIIYLHFLVQSNEYSVKTAGTDGWVFQHHGMGTYPCVSGCLWINQWYSVKELSFLCCMQCCVAGARYVERLSYCDKIGQTRAVFFNISFETI